MTNNDWALLVIALILVAMLFPFDEAFKPAGRMGGCIVIIVALETNKRQKKSIIRFQQSGAPDLIDFKFLHH